MRSTSTRPVPSRDSLALLRGVCGGGLDVCGEQVSGIDGALAAVPVFFLPKISRRATSAPAVVVADDATGAFSVRHETTTVSVTVRHSAVTAPARDSSARSLQ